MQTDRELLELAARAAGLTVRSGRSFQADRFFVDAPSPDGVVAGREWNPLEDDGDALRLAVQLRMDIFGLRSDQVVTAGTGRSVGQVGFINADPFAATRRAIVRAAAALAAPQPQETQPHE